MNQIQELSISETAKKSLPKFKEQEKICYPGYFRDSEFRSLRDAVCRLKKSGSLRYSLLEIIKYNICYRDYLREHGMELLIRRMVSDVPELAEDQDLLQNLREWYDKEGKYLSEYDIQCYNIKDTITVLGHEFHGLEDVKTKIIPGLYVCEFYEPYPTFDACDRAFENRTYQNYLFTSEPIDEDKLTKILDMGYGSNYRMVREGIPGEMLPLLYYEGEGNYMLLAQNK